MDCRVKPGNDRGRGPDVRHRPCSFVGPGQALVLFASRQHERLPSKRGDGAPRWRLSCSSPPCGGGAFCENALAIRRSTCGVLCPWTRSSVSGVTKPFRIRPCIRRAFALVHPDPVQPLKAAPRSRSGRAPRASRRRGANPPAGAARPSGVSAVRLRSLISVANLRHDGPAAPPQDRL
jgi:hypothetical protein